MNLEELDLNLMLCLHWLLEEGSVTKAAEHCRVTQPAMSRSLRRLRQLFHDDLLVRAGRSMALTPLAERLRPEIGDAIVRNLYSARWVMYVVDIVDPTVIVSYLVNDLGATMVS